MSEIVNNKPEERLYIIRWTFDSGIKKPEDRVEYFGWEERQTALIRYLKLQQQWHASNLRFQVAQPQDIDINTLLQGF